MVSTVLRSCYGAGGSRPRKPSVVQALRDNMNESRTQAPKPYLPGAQVWTVTHVACKAAPFAECTILQVNKLWASLRADNQGKLTALVPAAKPVMHIMPQHK